MDALKFSGLPDYANRYYSQHFSLAAISEGGGLIACAISFQDFQPM